MRDKPEGILLQVRRIGNSIGLILPKELLARLKLQEGDKLRRVLPYGFASGNTTPKGNRP